MRIFMLFVISLIMALINCGGEIDVSDSRFSCKDSKCPDGFECNTNNYCIEEDDDDDSDDDDSTNGTSAIGGAEGYYYECGEEVSTSAQCKEYLECSSCCEENDSTCLSSCESDYLYQGSSCYICLNNWAVCGQAEGCDSNVESDEFIDCAANKCPTELITCYGIPS